ncbi:MAG: hypothetical protein IT371_10715 [Deltaproteobacteria bacterium]|nr:hypothetical protein [Deltaproteobacteria bacterium]
MLRERRSALQRNEGLTVQVCLTAPTRALCGLVAAHELPTTAAGGRARSRAPKHAPSRAARKLVEAFDWIGQGPEPGERVVDLGAAPGGWTAVLLERGAHVVAVDLGQMDPALARHRNLRVIHGNAFHHEPEEPVGWLFCDLAWRPLEVASLLAKWGRRGWTDALVANLKLPMRKKLGFVERLRGMLGEGFRTVRARQLYHDREEVTFAAWRR